jgi:hypothetical protein
MVVVAAVAATATRNGFKRSQCNVAWGGYAWARGSGCLKFDPHMWTLDQGQTEQGDWTMST